MKKYSVTIDFESCTMEVEANSKEEAEEKAYEEFKNKNVEDTFPEFWVADGETEEVEECKK